MDIFDQTPEATPDKPEYETVENLHETVNEILSNPVSRYLALDGVKIPAYPAMIMMQREMESISSPENENLLLSRLASRIGFDQLIKSHALITSYFLTLADSQEITLEETTFTSAIDVKTQRLKIDPKGNYSDAQISHIMVNLFKKVKGARSEIAELRAQNKSLSDKLSSAEEKASQASRALDEIKNAPKTDKTIGRFVIYQNAGKVGLGGNDDLSYIGFNAQTEEYTLVKSLTKAKTFASAQDAFAFYTKLMHNRKYDFYGASKLVVGAISINEKAWNSFLSSSDMFTLEKERSRISDYEDALRAEETPRKSENVSSDGNFDKQVEAKSPQPKSELPKKKHIKNGDALLQSLLNTKRKKK